MANSSVRIEPATQDEFAWVAEIDVDAHQSNAVPFGVMNAWYEQNGTAFFIIRNTNGAATGHLTMLPVRPGPLRQLCDQYVESIIVSGNGLARDAPIRQLLLSFPECMGRLCEPANVDRLFARRRQTVSSSCSRWDSRWPARARIASMAFPSSRHAMQDLSARQTRYADGFGWETGLADLRRFWHKPPPLPEYLLAGVEEW